MSVNVIQHCVYSWQFWSDRNLLCEAYQDHLGCSWCVRGSHVWPKVRRKCKIAKQKTWKLRQLWILVEVFKVLVTLECWWQLGLLFLIHCRSATFIDFFFFSSFSFSSFSSSSSTSSFFLYPNNLAYLFFFVQVSDFIGTFQNEEKDG